MQRSMAERCTGRPPIQIMDRHLTTGLSFSYYRIRDRPMIRQQQAVRQTVVLPCMPTRQQQAELVGAVPH